MTWGFLAENRKNLGEHKLKWGKLRSFAANRKNLGDLGGYLLEMWRINGIISCKEGEFGRAHAAV